MPAAVRTQYLWQGWPDDAAEKARADAQADQQSWTDPNAPRKRAWDYLQKEKVRSAREDSAEPELLERILKTFGVI